MDLFDVVIARKLSGGGGGGGSSDFSTAEVTFICTNPSWGYTANAPICDDNIPSLVMSSFQVTDPVTVTVPMYKGQGRFPLGFLQDAVGIPTASGGVAVSMETFEFVVTGDGTITATGQECN